jgi:hypothetical protein
VYKVGVHDQIDPKDLVNVNEIRKVKYYFKVVDRIWVQNTKTMNNGINDANVNVVKESIHSALHRDA